MLDMLKMEDGDGAESLNAPGTVTPTPATANDSKDKPNSMKANKGMILRKSVDYIRYLQQLVSAQASRNRELEDELAGYRTGRPSVAGDAAQLVPDDMGGMILHDEDVGAFMGMGALGADGGVGVGAWHFPSAAGLNGLGMLASVREDMDVEDGDDGDKGGKGEGGKSDKAGSEDGKGGKAQQQQGEQAGQQQRKGQ